MRNTFAALVGIAGLCAVVGCSSSNAETRDAEANRSLKDSSEPGSGVSAGSAASSGTGAYAPVGVASCDAYLDRMEACAAKMPADAQPGVRRGLAQTRDAWRKAAAGQGASSPLDDACQKATAALGQSNSYCAQ